MLRLVFMAIDARLDFPPNSRGSQGAIFGLSANPSIGNVVDGSFYYPGSTIQIQEIIDIQSSIYDESLVDVDLNWYEPKQYLGTYQIQADIGLTRAVGDDGFLTSQFQRIVRYSYYTVISDGSGAVVLPNSDYINDCNYDARQDIISNPPAVNIERFTLDDKGEDFPIFTVERTLAPVPLANDRFYPRMLGVGLFLRPGVELDFVRYRARAINGVRVALNSTALKTCSISRTTCKQRFIADYGTPVRPVDNPNPQPDTGTSYYLDFALAESLAGGAENLTPGQYDCNDGTSLPFWSTNF